MLNKVTAGLLLLSMLGYAVSVAVGDPFAYIPCFVLLVLAILFLQFVQHLISAGS